MPEEIATVADSVPRSIHHVVASGENRRVVEQIQLTLESTFATGQPYPHSLLCGGPGCGKTLLATVVARELGAEPTVALGQTLRTAEEVNGLLVGLSHRAVCILDEVHTLGAPGQHALLRALENNEVFIEGTARRPRPTTIKLPPFTLLACTTDEYLLVEPLRDRFRLTHRLSPYSPDDVECLLRQRVRLRGWEVDDAVYPLVSARARGVPRIAIRILESVWRTATAEGTTFVGVDHAIRTFALEGLDAAGLNQLDRDYLGVLAEARESVRLNVLATRLGVPAQTLVRTVEPYLIRVGLLTKASDGARSLTAKGDDHVRSQTTSCQESEQ